MLGFYHYHGFLDYDRALEEFAIALRGEPSSTRFPPDCDPRHERRPRLLGDEPSSGLIRVGISTTNDVRSDVAARVVFTKQLAHALLK